MAAFCCSITDMPQLVLLLFISLVFILVQVVLAFHCNAVAALPTDLHHCYYYSFFGMYWIKCCLFCQYIRQKARCEGSFPEHVFHQ